MSAKKPETETTDAAEAVEKPKAAAPAEVAQGQDAGYIGDLPEGPSNDAYSLASGASSPSAHAV